jgi:hypothetical protein
VVARKPEFAFLGDAERARARQAIDKGVECILKTQVVQEGKLTVWCAQHDERTLAPAKARAYERPFRQMPLSRFFFTSRRPRFFERFCDKETSMGATKLLS